MSAIVSETFREDIERLRELRSQHEQHRDVCLRSIELCDDAIAKVQGGDRRVVIPSRRGPDCRPRIRYFRDELPREAISELQILRHDFQQAARGWDNSINTIDAQISELNAFVEEHACQQ